MSTDTKSILREYQAAFLQCRTLGHSWAYEKVILRRNLHGRVMQYDEVVRCTRCRSSRVKVLDPEGYVERTHYTYAEGYLVHHSDVPLSYHRNLCRLEIVARMGEEEEDYAPQEATA